MLKKTAGHPLKYALIERERKFLIAPGEDLIKGLHFKTITDQYVESTYLRLRKVTDKFGSVYKLTQKCPDESLDRSVITTIYLTEFEYDLLSQPGSVIVEKTRFIKETRDLIIGIDRYVSGNDELWLAEIEFDNDGQMRQFIMPLDYSKEVTDDINFNGYHLAKRFSGEKSG
jgi:CYTH domain-containing protein